MSLRTTHLHWGLSFFFIFETLRMCLLTAVFVVSTSAQLCLPRRKKKYASELLVRTNETCNKAEVVKFASSLFLHFHILHTFDDSKRKDFHFQNWTDWYISFKLKARHHFFPFAHADLTQTRSREKCFLKKCFLPVWTQINFRWRGFVCLFIIFFQGEVWWRVTLTKRVSRSCACSSVVRVQTSWKARHNATKHSDLLSNWLRTIPVKAVNAYSLISFWKREDIYKNKFFAIYTVKSANNSFLWLRACGLHHWKIQLQLCILVHVVEQHMA